MRKLILETQMSIDGYIAGTDGDTNWMLWNWGPEWKWDRELQKYHNALTMSVDCILLSRKMAEEGFIAHWAKTAENPQDPRFTFANHITSSQKIVFSKTIDQSKPIPGGWEKASIAKGDIAIEINHLKKQNGKNIIAYGGSTFVSSLAKAGLIDEYHLIINPTAIGNGMTIFKGLESKLDLTLGESRSYPCGIIVCVYRKARYQL